MSEFRYRFSEASLADEKMIRSASALGVAENAIPVVKDADGVDRTSELSLSWSNGSLTINFSLVTVTGVWSLEFNTADVTAEDAAYSPIEVYANFTAAANDKVVCQSSGLEVTLPDLSNGSMVKISTSALSQVKICPTEGRTIGGGYVYFLSASSFIEVAYNTTHARWVIFDSSDEAGRIGTQTDYDDENSCIAHRTNIQTREHFKDWIYRKLGWPLLSVELTDEMLDDCINDSILELAEYAYQNRKFYAFSLPGYVQDVGIELPIGITVITRVSSNLVGPNAVGAGKMDNYMNDLVANGAVGFPMLGRPAGAGWVNYEMAMSYLDLSQKMLGGDYDFAYDPRSRILTLYPDPKRAGQEKGWIVVECQCMRKDDQQFGDSWTKKMALAKARIVLGTVRSKFTNVGLPGGGELNSSDREDGRNDEEALMTELRERFPICNVWMQ